jgi:hypothetical protein
MTIQLSSPILGVALAALSFESIYAGDSGKGVAAAATASVVEPAVSGINGKFEGAYGAINESYTRSIAGSLSFPLGQSFGAQLDTLFQHGFESDIYGLGGHFFHRNPSKGLLGLAFAGLTSTDFTDALVGVEGEYYFGSVTLGAFVGYNHHDARVISAYDSVADERNFVAARLFAAIYPTSNLMLRLEYHHRFGRNFYMAHVEYQTPIRGVALFMNGGVGDSSYSHLLGGVRIYFGGDKSLKDRHRKDDPDSLLRTFQNNGTGAASNGGGGNGGGGGGIGGNGNP